jgi:hypothetical protein
MDLHIGAWLKIIVEPFDIIIHDRLAEIGDEYHFFHECQNK